MPKRKISGKVSATKRGTGTKRKETAKKRTPRKGGESYVRFSDKLTGSLEDIGRIIEENKQTMDSIQDIGLELAQAAGVLEATASRYVGMVDSLLETAVPILRNIPLLPDRTMELIEDLQGLANTILDVCTTADKVITDVDDGLRKADVAKLNAHTGDLQKMTKALQRVLPD
ncbi:MAG TPA: hypothetical protein VMW58_14185 [Anaerolineae bacterium]|nr:hypothetical protein [Anaerolineae bacterium]